MYVNTIHSQSRLNADGRYYMGDDLLVSQLVMENSFPSMDFNACWPVKEKKLGYSESQLMDLNNIVLPDDLEGHKAPPQELVPAPGGLHIEKPLNRVAVPKKRDLVSQYAQHAGPIVTLMICNIPCRITQQQLILVIDRLGFADQYDFLYLPTAGRMSVRSCVSNLGYGFINFIEPEYAYAFTEIFMSYRFDGTSSTKACTVRPAHIQGLQNNITHFNRILAKGKPRREGPFIRSHASQECLKPVGIVQESAVLSEPASKQLSSAESWLESSYLDLLCDTPAGSKGHYAIFTSPTLHL